MRQTPGRLFVFVFLGLAAPAAGFDKKNPLAGNPLIAPHVKIVFGKKAYAFTLKQAAAGIAIPYEITVTKAVGGVIPHQVGSCQGVGPSGLIAFEQLTGNKQSYALYDCGASARPPWKPAALKKGKHKHKFKWDGRNWSGPSDTGMAKGKAFPVGVYQLKVSCSGVIVTPKGNLPFNLTKTIPITLTK